MSDWIQKAKDFVKGHPEQAQQGLDKAEELINERTGGKYADQIDQGSDKLKETLGLPPDADDAAGCSGAARPARAAGHPAATGHTAAGPDARAGPDAGARPRPVEPMPPVDPNDPARRPAPARESRPVGDPARGPGLSRVRRPRRRTTGRGPTRHAAGRPFVVLQVRPGLSPRRRP